MYASRNTLRAANAIFEQGKYREAAIQFQNAIQVDDRYADAHYQLYQTYVKLTGLGMPSRS